MDSFQSKSPTELRPYWFDCQDVFTALSDVCSGAVVEAVDPDTDAVVASSITVLSTTATAAGLVEFWVSGGAIGDSATFRVQCTGTSTTPQTVVATKYGVLHVDVA